MRVAWIAAGLLTVLLLASPTAEAATATTTLTGPDGAVHLTRDETRLVPVRVDLEASDFACLNPSAFDVTFRVEAPEGMTAHVEPAAVAFPVQATSYHLRPFKANATVHVALTSHHSDVNDDTVLHAAITPPGDACVAVGGFQTTASQLAIRIVVQSPPDEASNDTPPEAASPSQEEPSRIQEPDPMPPARPSNAGLQGDSALDADAIAGRTRSIPSWAIVIPAAVGCATLLGWWISKRQRQ